MEENVEISSTISFCSHPLFSCFVALYTLILIYFPHDSLRIFLSPVLLISGSLLLFLLLRLGSTQESITRPGKGGTFAIVNLEEGEEESKVSVRGDSSPSEAKRETGSDTKPDFFPEWNLRAPLEVIHEAYDEDNDGEEEEEEENKTRPGLRKIERFPSLSLCYPESDSESDSDSSSEFSFPEMDSWMSPEKMGLIRWEEEDDGIGGEGLIEIKLDEYHHHSQEKMSKRNQTELDFHAEEDGLIEIDLFH